MKEYANCKNCEYSEVNETLGKRVCKIFNQVIYVLLDTSDCPRYKKKEDFND